MFVIERRTIIVVSVVIWFWFGDIMLAAVTIEATILPIGIPDAIYCSACLERILLVMPAT